MTEKPTEKFDARDVIGIAGLAALGVGIAQFSWPCALIAIGGILIAVAAGYLR